MTRTEKIKAGKLYQVHPNNNPDHIVFEGSWADCAKWREKQRLFTKAADDLYLALMRYAKSQRNCTRIQSLNYTAAFVRGVIKESKRAHPKNNLRRA